MSTVYTIEHRIVSGSQFNGAAPALSGTPLEAQDAFGGRIFVNVAGTQVDGDAGGLFDFPFVASTVLWKVDRVLLFLDPGTTAYTLSVIDSALSASLDIATGTDSVLLTDVATLAPTEQLSLVTTGGTGQLVARVTARPMIVLPPDTMG